MIKIMMVDDEQIVLDGLKFMIQESFYDVEIIAMVNSGRAAIEAINNMVPDIILMDIKMPGINGIEAIETIKKRHSDIKFILVSAYEQFEYAKQAVELGVSDYILKPVIQCELVDVLKKVFEEIEEEREQRQRIIENKEKLEKVIPVLENGFIYALLMNADYREELYKYKELFEVSKEFAYIMVFEFGEGDSQHKLLNKIGTGVKGQEFYPMIHNAIKYKCKCIVGPMIINRITVLVYEDESEREYEQRVEAIKLAEAIRLSIAAYIDSHIHIGIGGCYSLEKIKNSLEESHYALGRISDESVLHVNDVIEKITMSNDYTYVDIKGDETYIIKLVESGKDELLTMELNQFFNRIEKKFDYSLSEVMNIVTELMVMVLGCSYRNELHEDEVGYATYLGELRRFESVIELRHWCIRRIGYITELIQKKRHMHVSKVVLKAKILIDERYNEDLTLGDVSKEVAVSPQYFSKIFKEEIGLTFVEYIRMTRMNVAKDMLRTNSFSIKEICYKIGYNDPNYFSRLFKKLVGVSPTDYK